MFQIVGCEFGIGLVAAYLIADVIQAGSHGIVEIELIVVIGRQLIGQASAFALGICALAGCCGKEEGEADGYE